jgi:hypothetical protein
MSSTVIEQLLSSHGFELARQKKHRIYKREDGVTFVAASTPSDWRAERNQISDLCRVIGLNKHRLLASLERRRTRIRAVVVPGSLPNTTPPPIALEKTPTRQEKMLAKRIARIDRNREEKAGRGLHRLDLFFARHALMFVDDGEIIFPDNRGLKLLGKTIARRIESPRPSAPLLSARYDNCADLTVEVIITNPDVLCLFNCPHRGVSFVFKDGSVVLSNMETAKELHDELKSNV